MVDCVSIIIYLVMYVAGRLFFVGLCDCVLFIAARGWPPEEARSTRVRHTRPVVLSEVFRHRMFEAKESFFRILLTVIGIRGNGRVRGYFFLNVGQRGVFLDSSTENRCLDIIRANLWRIILTFFKFVENHSQILYF